MLNWNDWYRNLAQLKGLVQSFICFKKNTLKAFAMNSVSNI